ncbi:Serine protease family S01A [Phytophthora palmivora]|uniref:Serine protease family S01A n=1 Tax=Phytophthora palmivora TaxID=4796 RepID=A0A2P4X3D2_9STRA|nr:Serine protease family S01A [Phytophthora palmivora]
MVLTPQQTRNILHQVLDSTTLARTKSILDAFAETDSGNEVLLVRSQMDASCVTAFQTSVQKKWFIQWITAVILIIFVSRIIGSLVVPSDTGRGVPVIDFLSVDQSATTIEHIIEFFNAKIRRGRPFRPSLLTRTFWSGECWRMRQAHLLLHFKLLRCCLLCSWLCCLLVCLLVFLYVQYHEKKFESEVAVFSIAYKEESHELLKYFTTNWKS